MSKRTCLLVALVAALALATSCQSAEVVTTDYYVEGHHYLTQESGQFSEPIAPTVEESRRFVGWTVPDTDNAIYSDWANSQPESQPARLDAVYEDVRRINFYAGDELVATQLETEFYNPGKPGYVPSALEEFAGWAPEGITEIITDWTVVPEADAIVAVYKPLVKFYVGDQLVGAVSDSVFNLGYAGPTFNTDTPDTLNGTSVFTGWLPAGGAEVVTDWTTAPMSDRLDATYVDLVNYYIDGELWLTQTVDEFAEPDTPEGRDIPRGYTFQGWAHSSQYDVPTTDWSVLPEGERRFDAILSQGTITSAISDTGVKIELMNKKNFTVLGPVSVSETYEIVDGSVEIGGVGYNDIISQATRLYRGADQVIDIVVDYQNQSVKVDDQTFVFQTAVYTGLAIDIN